MMAASRLEDLFADSNLFGDASESEVRDRHAKRRRDDDGLEDIPALPPPLSPVRNVDLGDNNDGWRGGEDYGRDDNTNTAEGGEGQGATATRKARKIRRKFDELVLCGGDGLKRIWEEFPKIKFEGKGRETADIRRLMRCYEEWAHKMFPDYTFTDSVERIEKLASMGFVRNYVNSMLDKAKEEEAVKEETAAREEEEWADGLHDDDDDSDEGDARDGPVFMRSNASGAFDAGPSATVTLSSSAVSSVGVANVDNGDNSSATLTDAQAQAIEAKRLAALARLAERKAAAERQQQAATVVPHVVSASHAPSIAPTTDECVEEEEPFEDDYAAFEDAFGRDQKLRQVSSLERRAQDDNGSPRGPEAPAAVRASLLRDFCETLSESTQHDEGKTIDAHEGGSTPATHPTDDEQRAEEGVPLVLLYAETQAPDVMASQVDEDGAFDARDWD
eukprot:Opistho-2@53878